MEKGKMGSWGVNSQFIRDLALLIPVSDEIHIVWRCLNCWKSKTNSTVVLGCDCAVCGSSEVVPYLNAVIQVKGGA